MLVGNFISRTQGNFSYIISLGFSGPPVISPDTQDIISYLEGYPQISAKFFKGIKLSIIKMQHRPYFQGAGY